MQEVVRKKAVKEKNKYVDIDDFYINLYFFTKKYFFSFLFFPIIFFLYNKFFIF